MDKMKEICGNCGFYRDKHSVIGENCPWGYKYGFNRDSTFKQTGKYEGETNMDEYVFTEWINHNTITPKSLWDKLKPCEQWFEKFCLWYYKNKGDGLTNKNILEKIVADGKQTWLDFLEEKGVIRKVEYNQVLSVEDVVVRRSFWSEGSNTAITIDIDGVGAIMLIPGNGIELLMGADQKFIPTDKLGRVLLVKEK